MGAASSAHCRSLILISYGKIENGSEIAFTVSAEVLFDVEDFQFELIYLEGAVARHPIGGRGDQDPGINAGRNGRLGDVLGLGGA